MENFRFGKLEVLFVFVLLCCSKKDRNGVQEINGHWYSSYGGEEESYGEVIYMDGQACFYSFDFGLIYRDYKINRDTIIGIYNQGILDNERRIDFLDINTICQIAVSDGDSTKNHKCMYFYRIKSSDIDSKKIFSLDTAEQNKFIRGFKLRNESWDTRK
jgi:hypothetical protein